MRLPTNWGESGPEADIPIGIGSIVMQIEGKGPAIYIIVPIAASKGQPNRTTPSLAILLEAANNPANFRKHCGNWLISFLWNGAKTYAEPKHGHEHFCPYIHKI